MGNLLVSLRNTAEAMRVYERGMGVVQANVTNASTPGYARQRQVLEAMRMDLDAGLPGGVRSGGTLDGRNEYAEALVRRRAESLGYADERARQLDALEPVYDISSSGSLSSAMDRLFQSFSALTVAPNDLAARQVVLDRASELARNFRAMDASLQDASASTDKSLAQQVDAINRVVAGITALNKQFRADFEVQNDAGVQAQMNNLLEQLSELGNFTVLRNDDGSATVYLGGQTLVAVGEQQLPIALDASSSVSARILDAAGQDVTGQVDGGRLAALLEIRNQTLPAKRGELDRLAQTLADAVNTVLAGGVDLDGNPPVKNLFQYDAMLGAARTLTTTDLAPRELAAAASGSPGGNGVALQASALGQAKVLDGGTFTQFFAAQAADVGRMASEARAERDSNQGLVTQARQFREEIQGVNLDQEAVALIEYQRAYQAAAQLVRTLNDMTETVINLIR
jgi:flagellar hook-associated protein 1 FlgK